MSADETHQFNPTPVQHSEPRVAGIGRDSGSTVTINLSISDKRRRQLLGGAADTPSASGVTLHTMRLVIWNLKSWPRLMSVHGTEQLPPIIHKAQLGGPYPVPLANCLTLVKMWRDHAPSSTTLVHDTILAEVRRLLREHSTYQEMDLLAAAQSLLILMVILFFCLKDSSQASSDDNSREAEILIAVSAVKCRLATTGLRLDAELNNQVPDFREWAVMSAKRRTILSFHHLEWSWSLLHAYPVLTCFELGPMLAPEAGYLWRENDERTWKPLYAQWLDLWKDGGFLIAELFYINGNGPLSVRAETWLSEADEYGGLLMAEGRDESISYHTLGKRNWTNSLQ